MKLSTNANLSRDPPIRVEGVHGTDFLNAALISAQYDPPCGVTLSPFTTSLRDVEDLLVEDRTDVSYKTVRCWASKFGPAIAANVRRKRGRPGNDWHLDEMLVRNKWQTDVQGGRRRQ